MDERVGQPKHFVPHYLPGQYETHKEFQTMFGIPQEAAFGGTETLYPEYMPKLAELQAALLEAHHLGPSAGRRTATVARTDFLGEWQLNRSQSNFEVSWRREGLDGRDGSAPERRTDADLLGRGWRRFVRRSTRRSSPTTPATFRVEYMAKPDGSDSPVKGGAIDTFAVKRVDPLTIERTGKDQRGGRGDRHLEAVARRQDAHGDDQGTDWRIRRTATCSSSSAPATDRRTSMNRIAALVAVLACSALLPAAAYAQASIAGQVKDASGAVLPGVTVEAASPALIEKVRTVVTDGTGQYRVEVLPPGTYSLSFTLPGFNTVRRDGLILAGTFTAAVDAEMRVGAIEETITVTGETPLVDVQSADAPARHGP